MKSSHPLFQRRPLQDTYIVQSHLLDFEALNLFAVGCVLDGVSLLDKANLLFWARKWTCENRVSIGHGHVMVWTKGAKGDYGKVYMNNVDQ